jgi:hypothetical protein
MHSETIGRKDLILVAIIFGVCHILASVVLLLGLWFAGTQIGGLSSSVSNHSRAVERAGDTIAQPRIELLNAVEVRQPVTIRGPGEDGTLPVQPRLTD